MLRQDHEAGFLSDHQGFLWRKRYFFVATGLPPIPIGPEKLNEIRQITAMHAPRWPLWIASNRERNWWWFEGKYYWENGGYGPEDIVALVRDADRTGICSSSQSLQPGWKIGPATIVLSSTHESVRVVGRNSAS